MEQNSRFTISGRANDFPLPYADGKRRILAGRLAANLGMSALNNAHRSRLRADADRTLSGHRKTSGPSGWVGAHFVRGLYVVLLSKTTIRQAGLNAVAS